MELRSEQSHGESYFHSEDAIFALATVPGKSAVAVFRCSGRQIWHWFAQSFSRYSRLVRAASHMAIYGFLRQPQTGELLDEVLLLKFCAPHSYTGEDMLEIHCHGSIAVLDGLRGLLQSLGLREAERGEFTYRSIQYGKRSLHQAEAIALLAESHCQNQRRSALQQLNSPLLQKLQQMRGELLQVLARSELQLDYDETELEFYCQLPDSLPLATNNLQYLQNCLASYQLQQSCWRDYKIVLVGVTNSGKSSLFNYLLAQDRSIVSQQAGTTRDYVEARLQLAGQSILLYDTAGLRGDSDDPIEWQGMERTWQLLEQADLLLLVSDVRIAAPASVQSVPQSWSKTWPSDTPNQGKSDLNNLDSSNNSFDNSLGGGSDAVRQLRQYRSQLQAMGRPVIEIWNKCDLVPKIPARPQLPQELCDSVFCCSVKNGRGLAALPAELERRMPSYLSEPVEAPVSERQAKLLRQAAELLQEYCDGLQQDGFDLDWGSELLRQICGRLGEMTGEAANAVMLREIFNQFCVGK